MFAFQLKHKLLACFLFSNPRLFLITILKLSVDSICFFLSMLVLSSLKCSISTFFFIFSSIFCNKLSKVSLLSKFEMRIKFQANHLIKSEIKFVGRDDAKS